ncbi:hypothetical protein GJAV_G00001670 [Gymnothorax javanicus]|nr:hypothetical protein GJAV_G00001670 [Gymnothorax javanicus]
MPILSVHNFFFFFFLKQIPRKQPKFGQLLHSIGTGKSPGGSHVTFKELNADGFACYTCIHQTRKGGGISRKAHIEGRDCEIVFFNMKYTLAHFPCE